MVKLNIVLSSRKTQTEIDSISITLAEDMGAVSVDNFKECLRRYRRNNRFFPTPFDLLQEYGKLRKEHSVKELPAPDELTDEQVKLNLDRIAKLKQRLKIKPVPPAKTTKKGARYADLNTKHAHKVREQAKEVLNG